MIDRSEQWDLLCQSELSGTVTWANRNGDFKIRPDVKIVHPDHEKAFNIIYGGLREGIQEGDRVAFRLDRRWKKVKQGRDPDPVERGSVRLLGPDEVIVDVENLKALEPAASKLKAVESELEAKLLELEATEQEAKSIEDSAAAIEAEANELLQAARQAETAHREEVAIFSARGGERFMRAISPATRPPARKSRRMLPSTTVIDDLCNHATDCGLIVEEPLARRVLIAHVVAALTGQLIVYGGPPGAGKTSLSSWMPRALDMEADVVAVRPGWLDAVDLLGYFNPGNSQFVPAPFLDHVMKARDSEDDGLLNLVTLDEMNIARIENYAADFLSQLEKAHEPGDGGQLRLYSTTVQTQSDIERVKAIEDDLEPLQEIIPPMIPIPRNFVVAGTLNNDHTTEVLSPKVLDRALGIRVDSRKPAFPHSTITSPPPVFSLDLAFIDLLTRGADESRNRAETLWNELLALVADLNIPSIHLSYRSLRTVSFAPSISDNLDLEERVVFDELVCLKVLPWIRFFDGQDRTARDDLTKLAQRAADSGLTAVTYSIEQLLESEGDLVQYLR